MQFEHLRAIEVHDTIAVTRTFAVVAEGYANAGRLAITDDLFRVFHRPVHFSTFGADLPFRGTHVEVAFEVEHFTGVIFPGGCSADQDRLVARRADTGNSTCNSVECFAVYRCSRFADHRLCLVCRLTSRFCGSEGDWLARQQAQHQHANGNRRSRRMTPD